MYAAQETGTYYLRARYYDPSTGRFTQEDPHWGSANSIYGDTPMAAFQSKDALGLTYTSYAPQIFAIQQSGNLYVYCVGNPVDFVDPSGEAIPLWLISAAIGAAMNAASYVFTTISCGDQIDWKELLFTSLMGGLSGAAAIALGPWITGVFDILVSAFETLMFEGEITSDSGIKALRAAIFAGLSSFIPTGLGKMAKLDEVADMIVGVTAGGSIDAIGDMVEIVLDSETEISTEDAEENAPIAEEVDETTDTETPAEEEDPPLPSPDPIEPDSPERSGGSPTGPGDYIGPDKRQIAF